MSAIPWHTNKSLESGILFPVEWRVSGKCRKEAQPRVMLALVVGVGRLPRPGQEGSCFARSPQLLPVRVSTAMGCVGHVGVNVSEFAVALFLVLASEFVFSRERF